MSEELLDLVDKNDNVIGEVSRAKAHVNPKLIHREIAIFLFNSKKEVLLAQRSLKKKRAPGYWDISCAGHVDSKEDPLFCANRELKEELGITTELNFFDKHFDSSQNESRFIWCFYGIYEDNDFQIDKEEVEKVEWVKLLNLDSFDKNHLYDKDYWAHNMILEIAKYLNLNSL